MTSPRFSVVIPLYNKALSIGETLASALAQTFADFEVIVVDDGSTDGGGDAVAACADPRVRLIRQANGGVSVARNAGMAAAAADFVAFLDADDRWRPGFLATIAGLIGRFPGAGLYATGYTVSDGRAETPPRLSEEASTMPPGPMADFFRAATFGEMPFFTSCVCVDRAKALALGGFKPGVRHAEDLDLWARLALHHAVVYAPEIGAVYRTEAENRAMRRMPVLEPWVFRHDMEKELAAGTLLPPRSQSVAEFCARVDLFHVRGNLLNPDRRALRRFIDGIDTVWLARRKRIFRTCSYLPAPAVAAILRLYETAKRYARRAPSV